MKSRTDRLILWCCLIPPSLLVLCFVGLMCVVAITRAKHWRPVSIVGRTMEPALPEGDKLFVDESYYLHHNIADGDIIVFRHNGLSLVKRVTAIGGEAVEGRGGVLLRNGHALIEPYARYSKESSPVLQTFGVRVVPTDEIFVTGDNRDLSFDSRAPEFGAVKTSDVTGKAAMIYWSKHGAAGRTF